MRDQGSQTNGGGGLVRDQGSQGKGGGGGGWVGGGLRPMAGVGM